jgi:hypothetical protein
MLAEERLAGAVNRFAGLYAGRVFGLVRSGDRIYLLGSGAYTSRTGLRADVISAAPARHEFVAQRHVFDSLPARGDAVCLIEPDAANNGLLVSGQGAVILQPGRSVSLFDPSDPAVMVELKAANDIPMDIRGIAALSGRLGVYAGVMRQRGQRDASIAVQRADGRIAFRAVPDTSTVVAGGGSVTLAVAAAEEARPAAEAARTAPVAVEPAAAMAEAKPATIETRVPPARVEAQVVPAPAPATAPIVAAGLPEEPIRTAPAADRKQLDDASYENALRKLMERQGAGVRSISALTQVHPAIDALRALLR